MRAVPAASSAARTGSHVFQTCTDARFPTCTERDPSLMLASLLFLSASLLSTAPRAITPARVVECETRDYIALKRDPTVEELRCRYGIVGPGRFGLLSYVDVPV